jgi:hypothetical protein
MLIKALGHLLQIANLGIRFGSSQLSHNPVERGRHTLAPADLVILLRIFPQHDGRPANTAFAKNRQDQYFYLERLLRQY